MSFDYEDAPVLGSAPGGLDRAISGFAEGDGTARSEAALASRFASLAAGRRGQQPTVQHDDGTASPGQDPFGDEAPAERGTGSSAASATGTAAASSGSDIAASARDEAEGLASPASDANLQNETPDGGAEPVEDAPAQAEPSPAPPAEEAAAPEDGEEPELLPEGWGASGEDAPGWGSPMPQGATVPEASYDNRSKFAFDTGKAGQVKSFPRSLERLLRDRLARAANPDFARDLPISQLITAFAAAQLGVSGSPDANTAQALAAFRGSDSRLDSLERKLSDLDALSRVAQERSSQMMDRLREVSRAQRLAENALAFLVVEGYSPTSGISTQPPEQLRATGGRYELARKRLRSLTQAQLQQEMDAAGRMMR